MRDIIVVLGVAILCALIMRRAWIGVLAWTWIAILNPHKEAFGFSVDLRVNLMIVLVTLISVVASKEAKKWPGGAPAWLFVAFISWTTLATAMAADRGESFGFWSDFVIKMAIHIVLAMLLINSKHRLTALIWVVAISLGYHAVKIALVAIKSGLVIERLSGAFGPKDTMIMDRNHFALAMLMLCPILLFLSRQAKAGWVRLACLGIMGCALLSVIGSQSRGGFATMALMLIYLWWKSPRKFLFGATLAGMAALGVAFGPDSIKERLGTILDQTAEAEPADDKDLDESFCLRLAVWQIGFDMTKANPLLGMGIRSIQNEDVAGNYTSPNHICADKEKYGPRAAHNIYVEVMTDSGFVGLGLFVACLLATWFSLGRSMRRCRGRPELAWAYDLSSMLQVCVVGYMAGGMLLSLAYYDGYYLIMAMAVIVARLTREAVGEVAPRRVLAASGPRRRSGPALAAAPSS